MTVKKLAHLVLLVAPIIFLFITTIMVGVAGHSSGDMTYENLFLITFSIIYGYLILNKLNNKTKPFGGWVLIVLTAVILIVSSYFAIVAAFYGSSYSLVNYFIVFFMSFFVLCSVIVIIDTWKNI